MSKTTTTTEEFDTEGNLLKRTVEVWEDEPTMELDVAEEPEEEIADTTDWGPNEWYLYGLGQKKPHGSYPFVGSIKLNGEDIVGVIPYNSTRNTSR